MESQLHLRAADIDVRSGILAPMPLGVRPVYQPDVIGVHTEAVVRHSYNPVSFTGSSNNEFAYLLTSEVGVMWWKGRLLAAYKHNMSFITLVLKHSWRGCR